MKFIEHIKAVETGNRRIIEQPLYKIRLAADGEAVAQFQYAREYAIKNLGRSRESNRIWRGNNKEEIREYVKKYRRTLYYSNPLYRLKHQMSCLIRLMIVKSGLIKVKRTHEILGCDWDFFKSHIERQFPKGMTWENRSEWHIDHITPMATASTEEEVLALNHFTNLRPMWAKDNLAKGAQITHLI